MARGRPVADGAVVRVETVYGDTVIVGDGAHSVSLSLRSDPYSSSCLLLLVGETLHRVYLHDTFRTTKEGPRDIPEVTLSPGVLLSPLCLRLGRESRIPQWRESRIPQLELVSVKRIVLQPRKKATACSWLCPHSSSGTWMAVLWCRGRSLLCISQNRPRTLR
eukprot:TRINITY_DN18518_c0_g1_i1.p2 TRINITY_DN18518_c0_g1~~TRINITY_DN18518_c0_g1_i1.p2  ORF type:complete len:163 (+),score=26.45 TRINITY_DN18518_c0_g1_i1:384-872(+)